MFFCGVFRWIKNELVCVELKNEVEKKRKKAFPSMFFWIHNIWIYILTLYKPNLRTTTIEHRARDHPRKNLPPTNDLNYTH